MCFTSEAVNKMTEKCHLGGEEASSGEERRPEPDCCVLMRMCSAEMEAVRLESNLPQIWQLKKSKKKKKNAAGRRGQKKSMCKS